MFELVLIIISSVLCIVTCVFILVFISSICKGVNINIILTHKNEPVPPEAQVNLDVLQAKLDNMISEKVNAQTTTTDIVSAINTMMLGGSPSE